jgi:hypothetical protein
MAGRAWLDDKKMPVWLLLLTLVFRPWSLHRQSYGRLTEMRIACHVISRMASCLARGKWVSERPAWGKERIETAHVGWPGAIAWADLTGRSRN